MDSETVPILVPIGGRLPCYDLISYLACVWGIHMASNCSNTA